MFVTKIKIAAMMFLVISVAVGGVWTQARTAPPQAEAKADDPTPKPAVGDKKNAEPIAVNVVKPKKGGQQLMEYRFGVADLVAAQQQQIVPLISGTVKEVSVDIGDQVKKGQTLIVLDAPLLAKEVEEADASLEMAQAYLAEAEGIVRGEQAKHRLGGASDLDKAMASLRAAKAKVRLAQAVLDKARIHQSFTQLKAAFDGVVTRRTADPGNYVQPSDSRLLQPLLTVQRIDVLRVVIRVSKEHALLIKRGLPTGIRLAGGQTGAYRGKYKISRFSPALEGNNREMTVEIDVPNADHRLLPGMEVDVGMPFQKTSSENLIVPSACLFPKTLTDEKQSVYVYIVHDGKAQRKRVNVNYQDDESAEITAGIRASDLIITNPEKLKDGAPVKSENTP